LAVDTTLTDEWFGLICKLNADCIGHPLLQQLNQGLHITICIFNGEVWELKPKVRDLFANFTIENKG
jgi:hypothetical protein